MNKSTNDLQDCESKILHLDKGGGSGYFSSGSKGGS